jgi:CubicO group peptidase (beta-lactamase class C family)
MRPFVDVGAPCYHAGTYGLLAGELIFRVDGRSPGTFVAEELAGPLGDLELRLGFAAGDPVAGRLVPPVPSGDFRVGAYETQDPRFALVYPAGPPAYGDPDVLRKEFPSFGAVVSARAMASLYGRLVGGDGPVSPATLARGRAVASEGDDPLTGRFLRFGPTGYELAGTPSELGQPADAFGHTGAGGSTHGAWPGLGTGFSFVTRDLRLEQSDGRSGDLLDALWESVA